MRCSRSNLHRAAFCLLLSAFCCPPVPPWLTFCCFTRKIELTRKCSTWRRGRSCDKFFGEPTRVFHADCVSEEGNYETTVNAPVRVRARALRVRLRSGADAARALHGSGASENP